MRHEGSSDLRKMRHVELDARPSDEKLTSGGICMLVFTCLAVPIVMLGGETAFFGTGSTMDPSARLAAEQLRPCAAAAFTVR